MAETGAATVDEVDIVETSRKQINAGKQPAAARVLRQSFDVGYPCDERSSRKMQQTLSQRSEGSIYRKRSSLRGRTGLLATSAVAPVCHDRGHRKRACAARKIYCGL